MTDEERAATTARVVFLMAGLTDEGLDRLRTDAEFYAVTHARDLTSDTLAAEQAARHGLLADADAVLSKARRERTHGLNCDCGACVGGHPGCSGCDALSDPRELRSATDLHDSATDAAAVLGTTIGVTANGEHVQVNRWTDAARPPMMRERGGFTQRELDAMVRERTTVKP